MERSDEKTQKIHMTLVGIDKEMDDQNEREDSFCSLDDKFHAFKIGRDDSFCSLDEKFHTLNIDTEHLGRNFPRREDTSMEVDVPQHADQEETNSVRNFRMTPRPTIERERFDKCQYPPQNHRQEIKILTI